MVTTREHNKDTDPLKIKMSIVTITKNILISSALFALILGQWNFLGPSYKGDIAESFFLCCTMRLDAFLYFPHLLTKQATQLLSRLESVCVFYPSD